MAAKYGISYATLRARAEAEKWVDEREKVKRKVNARTTQKTADAVANNAVKFEKARGLALDRIISALEQMPSQGGSHTRQEMKDSKGKRVSVDYDLQALVIALEKLGQSGMTISDSDDPLTNFINRLDNEAGV